MEDRRHQVMLTGLDDAEALHVVSALGAFDIDFHRVAWSDGLIGIIKSREFDAILVRYPPEGLRMAAFVDALRSEGSRSQHAAVITLSEPRQVDRARRLIGHGINRVVALDARGDALRDTVLSMLDVARRYQLKAPVEISAHDDKGPLKAYCHTENLSLSGMLVSCMTRLPVGTSIEFSITIPGEADPIRGSARVARLTDPTREHVLGMGATFQSFIESDRSRLRSVLSRQVH